MKRTRSEELAEIELIIDWAQSGSGDETLSPEERESYREVLVEARRCLKETREGEGPIQRSRG